MKRVRSQLNRGVAQMSVWRLVGAIACFADAALVLAYSNQGGFALFAFLVLAFLLGVLIQNMVATVSVAAVGWILTIVVVEATKAGCPPGGCADNFAEWGVVLVTLFFWALVIPETALGAYVAKHLRKAAPARGTSK